LIITYLSNTSKEKKQKNPTVTIIGQNKTVATGSVVPKQGSHRVKAAEATTVQPTNKNQQAQAKPWLLLICF